MHRNCVTDTNLVDEGGEAVVQGLDLLLLLGADGLDAGVDLQVQRIQNALIELNRCNCLRNNTLVSAWTISTKATSEARTNTIACWLWDDGRAAKAIVRPAIVGPAGPAERGVRCGPSAGWPRDWHGFPHRGCVEDCPLAEQKKAEDVQASKGEPSPSEWLASNSVCFYIVPDEGWRGGSPSATLTCVLPLAVKPPLHPHTYRSKWQKPLVLLNR